MSTGPDEAAKALSDIYQGLEKDNERLEAISSLAQWTSVSVCGIGLLKEIAINNKNNPVMRVAALKALGGRS